MRVITSLMDIAATATDEEEGSVARWSSIARIMYEKNVCSVIFFEKFLSVESLY